MKITQILFKQHIGWHFAKHWHVQARKKPLATPALKILQDAGIPVHKPEDILTEERTLQKIEVIGYKEKPIVFDETHPDWHTEPLLFYKDENVLLEGLNQAKVLTKTVELQEGLPETIVLKDIPKEIDTFAKQIVKNSQIFDAEQKKLPKIKDPVRYFFNFPRVYGVTQNRRNTLIISKFLQLIESTSDQEIVQDRYLFSDLLFSFPFIKNDHQIQLQLTGDYFITSSKPLISVTKESTDNLENPDMSPLQPIISINKENIYKIENIYPINPSIKKKHPHTVFAFLNREEVKNQFEEPLTESQIFGRSLLKAFTVAASYAKQTYGADVKSLPEPVTVQCVQTDGQIFHFGILQLNTLDLENGTIKNIWFQTPFKYLFEKCSYNLGKPTLEGYNNEVLKYFYAFYNNV